MALYPSTAQANAQTRDQVQGLLYKQKNQFAGRLGGLAGALREAGEKLDQQDENSLGHLALGAADKVDRLSTYLRDRQISGLVRDAETFARRRPDLFLGGSFLAGLLLARFLKASNHEYHQTTASLKENPSW